MQMDKFRVSLVVGPLGSKNVIPLALPVIGSFLKSRGYHVSCWDFNIDFRNRLKVDTTDFFIMEDWYGITPHGEIVHEVDKFIYGWARQVTEEKPRVVGFSTHITSVYSNLTLASAIKKLDPNIITVLGGPECLYSWELLIQRPEIDYIILGDGEYPFADLLDSIRWNKSSNLPPSVITKGKQTQHPISAINLHFASFPFPDYSLLNLNKYQFKGEMEFPVYSSVGCTHHCTFCSRKFLHGKYRHKSILRIVNELENCKNCYGVSKFYFVDSLINANLDQLQAWTSLVKDRKLNITWRANAVFRTGMSLELMNILHNSGCTSLNFGLESASPRVLKDMRKFSDIGVIERAIKSAHEAGIRVTCFIIVGYPIETENDFEMTIEFLIRNRKNIDGIMVNTCYVGPGTVLDDNKRNYKIFGGGDDWYNDISNPIERKVRFNQIISLLNESSIPIIDLV